MAISFITENYRIKLKLENTAFFKFRVIQSWRERQTKIDSGDSGFAEMIIKDNSVFAEKINKDKWGGKNVETSGIWIILSIITIDLLPQQNVSAWDLSWKLMPGVEIKKLCRRSTTIQGGSSMGQMSSSSIYSSQHFHLLAVSYFLTLPHSHLIG